MMYPSLKSFKVTTILALGLIAVGCGKSSTPYVQQISAKAISRNNDLYADVSMSIGNIGASLPSISLPIPDPRNLSDALGSISMGNSGGFSTIALSVNMSRALVHGGDPSALYLPNGYTLPVASAQNAGVVRFRLSSGVTLYAGAYDQKLFVGTAVAIPFMDAIGNALRGIPTALFLPANLGNNIEASIGVFTGAPGQNGIGVFTVFPNEVQTVVPQPISGSLAGISSEKQSVSVANTHAPLGLTAVSPTGTTKLKLLQQLAKFRK